jgi:hypothetical protein|tara:strand:+ start:518 stop:790 length:273 start_codon:yes stop_codon:yes gene_type:complete
MANEEIQSDIPLSESEKEQLQEVVQMNQAVQQALGNLAVRKINLENEETRLKQQLSTNSQKETELAQKLESKYGKGSVNLETGTFTPITE